MARGYQGDKGDVKALSMKKWFNTNYHYIVPELDADTRLGLAGTKPFDEYAEAGNYGLETKPVIIGGFTFLKLARITGEKKTRGFLEEVAEAYGDILRRFDELGTRWVQFDEPGLVTDLSKEDIALFEAIYKRVLNRKGRVKVLLQTYFGDIRDCYEDVIRLDFDGIGLDFIEGKQTASLIKKYGFPKDKILFAGVLNGKNIWKCNYRSILEQLSDLSQCAEKVVLATSCSLLHVPYTLEGEARIPEEIKEYFAFAGEKLAELRKLGKLAALPDYRNDAAYLDNQRLFARERGYTDREVQARAAGLTEEDFTRNPARKDRRELQKKALKLPKLPTTTIGSFPQTTEVKRNRTGYHKAEITKAEYDRQVRQFIKECIEKQEELGLDVLVHGEFERNDMVEFFGENLSGFVFTDNAWVQSYGTRCVKPPVIFGDIKREKPITVEYIKYAQSLTDKPVKGMLTGPVTILNWSFPREDTTLKEMAYQLGLAIREEVSELEAAGIRIIQIDEAALKEKLPLRREDWYVEYLDWAIRAFRLCHARVKPETQIHTHMCYSEFEDIIKDIDNMDADVISFEASRSRLTILDALNSSAFETEVGPGVYDIHSPRIPGTDEIAGILKGILGKLDYHKLWVNPDCGLKTRGPAETYASLENMVAAAELVRKEL
jgi:5-methyltetrahydropteroyltriglutamate--homocysteine methyltransferase